MSVNESKALVAMTRQIRMLWQMKTFWV